MNLYYLNQEVNRLRMSAKENIYSRWRLGELLAKADSDGLHIHQDRSTGHITITQGYLHLADNLRFCNNIYHLDPIFFVKAY